MSSEADPISGRTTLRTRSGASDGRRRTPRSRAASARRPRGGAGGRRRAARRAGRRGWSRPRAPRRCRMYCRSRSPTSSSVGTAISASRSHAGTASACSPGSSASSARPFISRKRSRVAPDTRPSGAVGPSSQTRASSRFTVARSPRSSARSHSSSSDEHLRLVRRLGRATDRRPDQHQRPHAVGMGERQVERGPAAHRGADDDGAVGVVRVEHRHGVVDRGPSVLRLVRRTPVATRVVGQTSVAAGEPADDRRPAALVGDAGVDEQDVGSGTRRLGGQDGGS